MPVGRSLLGFRFRSLRASKADDRHPQIAEKQCGAVIRPHYEPVLSIARNIQKTGVFDPNSLVARSYSQVEVRHLTRIYRSEQVEIRKSLP